jgi:hypothetical protein
MRQGKQEKEKKVIDVTVCIKEPNADMQDPNPNTESVPKKWEITKSNEEKDVCEK